MKKIYIIPEMNVVLLHGETILSASGVTGKIGDNEGIGYGGVDVEGSLDADVKENSFEFEWE
jgi:hypothetical protein